MKSVLILLFSFTVFFNCTIKKSTGGEISLLSLQKAKNKAWYFKSYNNYTIDSVTLKEVSKIIIHSGHIDIFMGTWCEDSHREVPRFIKILEYLKFTNYRIIALDTDKKSKKGVENGKNIKRVPTFIFYAETGKELNRITEYPVISLEKDIYSIISKKKYAPNYSY
jgi:hypothetical protein